MDEMTAEAYAGRKMVVTLTGNNLHHNDNNRYWSKERDSYLKEHIDENGMILDSFDEDEICCKVNAEVRRFRSKIPEGKRIGFLEIYSELDYEKDTSVVFSSEKEGLGLVDLGRYGPHRREDVKDNLHYEIKNFIFDYEPSEWSYGISEKRLGRDQAVDITDDATGEVHSIARQNTPIYVNEVGHDKKLHCNVEIREKNDRSVYYYIFIDKDHAMKAGDQVELLVDYGEAYEDVRERKGYGKNNNELYGGDSDAAARLNRNFSDRDEVITDISHLKLFDMFYLVEFLTDDVFVHIDQRIRDCITAKGGDELFKRLSKDIVARLRMHWLRKIFQCRLKEMVSEQHPEDELITQIGGKEMIAAIEKSLVKWEFTILPDLFSHLNSVSNGSGKTLQDIILFELSEELLFSVSSKLPDPLNGTMWSKISSDLTESTARNIAKYLFCCKGPIHSRMQVLAEQLILGSKDAADRIRDASQIINNNSGSLFINNKSGSLLKDATSILSFRSLHRKLKKKDFAPNGSLINIYCNDLTLHHGAASAMADIQAYQDAVELGYLEPYFDPCATKKLTVTDSELSIVSQYASLDHNDTSQQFNWMARNINAFVSGVARVNEQWYILNQVLLPVHTLASACVELREFQFYTLAIMCEAIGVELLVAEESLKRGVARPNWPALKDKDNQEDGTKKKKKNRLRGISGVSRTVYANAPCEHFPAPWTVKGIQRINSTHVDNYWSYPGLNGIVVRSKVGVKEMIEVMEKNHVDVITAYNKLISEGKQKFFAGRRSDV
jgi:hypothetical protein